MNRFQELRYLRRILGARPLLLLLGAIAVFLAFKVAGMLVEIADLRMRIQKTESQIGAFEQRKAEFKEKINALNEGRGVEKDIRASFNIKKPGEHTIVIINDEAQKTPPRKRRGLGWISQVRSFLGL